MCFVRPASILAVALISPSISLVSAGVVRSPLLKPAVISSGTTAIALEDVDGDGDRDALIGNGGQNRLYINDGSGVFTDATATNLPSIQDHTTALVLSDVDGDGDRDALIGNYGQQNRLYLNDGAGVFTDATATHMPAAVYPTTSLATEDVDGDGDLDALIGNSSHFQSARLYLNDGAGVFTDVTASQLPSSKLRTTSVALEDVDGDGDRDALIGKQAYWGLLCGWPAPCYPYWYSGSRLYLNNGSGVFTDATSGHLPSSGGSTRSLAFEDVDGDGDRDLLIGDQGHRQPELWFYMPRRSEWWYLDQDRLYVNDGAGVFTEATGTSLPGYSSAALALVLEDVDGDGDRDALLGNGSALFPPLVSKGRRDPNRLYLNDGAGNFTDVTITNLPSFSDTTRALALEDVDGDGDRDALLGNQGHDRLYLNDGAGAFTDVTATHLP